MQPIYEHRQFGLAMWVIVSIPILIVVAATIFSGNPIALAPLSVLLPVLLAVVVIFGSLTVSVDREKVSLHFGLRSFRKSFALGEIRAVRVVRNSIFHGLGIHFFPGGLVYNVSGLDAVELTFDNHRRVRIGTDEPGRLAGAIAAAMKAG